MKSASEPTNRATEASNTVSAIEMFTFVLLLALIVGVPVWYFFGIDFSKVLAVALALATLQTLSSVLDVAWFMIPLVMLEIGLIAAVPVWLVFGAGFFVVLAVSLVLGILFPWLMGEEGRRDYEQTRKRIREDRYQEEQRQQEARLREAEKERLKQEQEERSSRPGRQGGGGDGGRTVPVRPHEVRAMSYKKYLQTPHWKRRREDKLRAAGRRCQVCNRSSGTLDVHHRTYERLGEELDGDLTVLCRDCHSIFHEHRRLGR